ncbi:regulatory protein RecX [Roseospirillum parvum]|uniref:Regulatory protein RecX n=1 Tax=Roseospirillum parvum TaxID=83401 RepID=A0A1G8BY70_9PROT|nr:regulatory protein RecX [Roseospirillum parvum]SDH38142.1 regulatory protein [Roseospirillum parvum]
MAKKTPPDRPPNHPPGRPPRRPPRPLTPERLEKSALAYLERYASSAENLRRVLMRKVARVARHHPTDPDQAAEWIDALVARYLKAGLLDDQTYAEGRARSLTRQGASARRIAATLAAKGVERDHIDAALASRDDGEDAAEADRAAAFTYARRRRLGPYRAPDKRAEHRHKDLAALARQGFSSDTAHAVIDADPEE